MTRASLESDPTDEYWERRYTLRDENILANLRQQRRQGLIDDSVLADDEHGGRGRLTGGAKIPNFLEPWKHQILLAGKYLNVIRECGIEVKPGQRAAGALQGSDAVPDYEEELIVMNDER